MIFLLNNTETDLLVEYHFYLNQDKENTIRKEINSYANLKLNEFKTDQLNDTPGSILHSGRAMCNPNFNFILPKK